MLGCEEGWEVGFVEGVGLINVGTEKLNICGRWCWTFKLADTYPLDTLRFL